MLVKSLLVYFTFASGNVLHLPQILHMFLVQHYFALLKQTVKTCWRLVFLVNEYCWEDYNKSQSNSYYFCETNWFKICFNLYFQFFFVKLATLIMMT